jgi:hypothetical protein
VTPWTFWSLLLWPWSRLWSAQSIAVKSLPRPPPPSQTLSYKHRWSPTRDTQEVMRYFVAVLMTWMW